MSSILFDTFQEVLALGVIEGEKSCKITVPEPGETLSKLEFSDGSRIEIDRSTEVFDEEGEGLFVVTIVSRDGKVTELEPCVAVWSTFLAGEYEAAV